MPRTDGNQDESRLRGLFISCENTIATHLFYDRFDRSLACLSAAGQVLREHLIDDSDLEAQTCTRAQRCYPSPSVGNDPNCRSKSSGLIGFVPVRLRISSIEVAFEGHSGAKISFTWAASSSVIESICACSSELVMT
jgi:hypothetical protein